MEIVEWVVVECLFVLYNTWRQKGAILPLNGKSCSPLINIIFQMDNCLFTPIPTTFSSAPLQPLLQSTFTINSQPILVTLTPSHLLLHADPLSPPPPPPAPPSLDLKFEVIRQEPQEGQSHMLTPALAIVVERENCCEKVALTHANPVLVEEWAIRLQQKINQRNFHKLFKAKKKLGKGAFATVYLAQRLRDRKMVAVKAFSKEKQYAGEKGRESLMNEIKLMRRLDHDNIMRLEGVYETENSIYVILEYLEGEQLHDMLRGKVTLSSQQTRAVMRNLLRGLSHLSRHRVIHRDLKPENIMFRKPGEMDLAICDFGLATYADEPEYLFVRCGTPGFVAPEIINIKDMSTKSEPISDVFSAGVIFHHLLFGCSVFEGKKYNEILAQNRASSFDFNRQPYLSLPESTFDLLTSMLERDPAKRPSADSALNHDYFNEEMELEVETKMGLFQELSNVGLGVPGKMEASTPSTFSHKENQKQNFEQLVKREGLRRAQPQQ